MSKEFQWTDELVKEAINSYAKSNQFDTVVFLKNFIASKQPKPSFTTANGVDIFKGDMYFLVEPNYSISEIKSWADDYSKSDTSVTFSTHEAAEQYVIENKPCLSFADFYKLLSDELTEEFWSIHHEVKDKLTNLIKSRLS